jgi:hypothetical protein
MGIRKDSSVIAGLAIFLALFTGIRASRAQTPPPPVTVNPIQSTLLQRLGITQSFEKFRDANVNRRGNNPQREAKPPLKSIADPANLQSPDPAVKAAAMIKQDQDLAPQKIKAIKYLATQCCCCDKYKGTPADPKMALLAALDDCTEQVRFAAAQALCQCSGDPCSACNKCGCCDPKIMNKLNKMANEQNDQGCWVEPSARVRAMAAASLEACRRVTAPTTEAPLQPVPAKETEPQKKAPSTKEGTTEPKPYREPTPAKKASHTIESSTFAPPLNAPIASVKPVVYVVPADPTDKTSTSVSKWIKAAPVLDSRWRDLDAAQSAR